MIDMTNLILESNAFKNGEQIPKKYGYNNDNINPPLTIKGIPKDTKSLVLIMDDPDAMGAVGKVWIHWVAWNIASTTTEIKENSIPIGTVEGKTDFVIKVCFYIVAVHGIFAEQALFTHRSQREVEIGFFTPSRYGDFIILG
jgi:phosphatidylethanolamine-binding protein (PEBP) family uncharacterized protein